jgi:hypothetical protein
MQLYKPNVMAQNALTMKLKLEQIVRDPEIQSRITVYENTVLEYVEALERGEVFPPVTVFDDNGTYYLVDGWHRDEAMYRCGRKEIEAEVKMGSRRDAILFSVGVNSNHGLRRSTKDKRKAVMTLLHDPEWVKWSDHEIAGRCHVSQPFVSNLRTTDPKTLSDTRMVRRGKSTYRMKVGKTAEGKAEDAEETFPQWFARTAGEADRKQHFHYFDTGKELLLSNKANTLLIRVPYMGSLPVRAKEEHRSWKLDLEKVWSKYLPKKGRAISMSADLFKLLEDDLSHVEIGKKRGGPLVAVQQDLYSGTNIRVQSQSHESLTLIDPEAEVKPFAVRTMDIKCLFQFSPNYLFYLQDELPWLFFECIYSPDRHAGTRFSLSPGSCIGEHDEDVMSGILGLCSYDELGKDWPNN